MELIIIHGPNGSGKTTVANMLHERLPGSVVIHPDDLQRSANDLSLFSPAKRILREQMTLCMVKLSLKKGHTVIIEQLYHDRDFINALLRCAKEYKAVVKEYFLTASWPVIEGRLQSGGYASGSLVDKEKAFKNWSELAKSRKLRSRAEVIDTSVFATKEVAALIMATVG